MAAEVVWEDGLIEGGGQRRLLLVERATGRVVPFGGSSIPGVVVVLAQEHDQNGKWSTTTYRLAISEAWAHAPLGKIYTGRLASWAELAEFIRSAVVGGLDVEIDMPTLRAWAAKAFAQPGRPSAELAALQGACPPRRIIATRHTATAAWLQSLPGWEGADVLPHCGADIVAGNIVAGNLPLGLAALAAEYHAVEFETPIRTAVGVDMTIEELRAAGPKLVRYSVRRVTERQQPRLGVSRLMLDAGRGCSRFRPAEPTAGRD
ncbi:MAG: hypothetical protein EBR82_42000 [Caulobacteraceae bacterium]|nr:hypothetical protein [Caulobacteraceae bacterium]